MRIYLRLSPFSIAAFVYTAFQYLGFDRAEAVRESVFCLFSVKTNGWPVEDTRSVQQGLHVRRTTGVKSHSGGFCTAIPCRNSAVNAVTGDPPDVCRLIFLRGTFSMMTCSSNVSRSSRGIVIVELIRETGARCVLYRVLVLSILEAKCFVSPARA